MKIDILGYRIEIFKLTDHDKWLRKINEFQNKISNSNTELSTIPDHVNNQTQCVPGMISALQEHFINKTWQHVRCNQDGTIETFTSQHYKARHGFFVNEQIS